MELALGLILIVAVGYLLYVNNKSKSVIAVEEKQPQQPEAPYKVEAPVVNEVVVQPVQVKEEAPVVAQEPEKKARKPRVKKAEKVVKPASKPASKTTKKSTAKSKKA